MSLFSSVPGGFQMTFTNGLTISVMFRGGNYCEHKDGPLSIAMDNIQRDGFHRSKDTEIAIWESTTNGRGRWINIGYDQVSGYHSLSLPFNRQRTLMIYNLAWSMMMDRDGLRRPPL